nr:mitochondrial 54S ribosomal protein L8 [Penicillium fuscum]
MAGGHQKYRHLSRNSAHRQAMLRNMVTSLITHESIRTTWHKAKEAQRLAEKLITLGKKNTNASRRRASQILFDPLDHFPKLFGTLRNRYLTRPGGYTRVLHIESLNRNHDQAPSAILELVDGPRDMRFAMTAKTLARERLTENGECREGDSVSERRGGGVGESSEEDAEGEFEGGGEGEGGVEYGGELG